MRYAGPIKHIETPKEKGKFWIGFERLLSWENNICFCQADIDE